MLPNLFSPTHYDWVSFQENVPDGFGVDPFKLSAPVSKQWKDRDVRLLVITQGVDSKDLKEHRVMSSFYGGVMTNLLNFAHACARRSTSKRIARLHEYGLAVLPFQFFKSYHLDPKRAAAANKFFGDRARRVIGSLKPTHVLCLGDTATAKVLGLDDHREKRGWAHTYEANGVTFYGLGTLDPQDLISVGGTAALDAALNDEDDGDEDDGGRDLYARTNLLGQVGRDMANIFLTGGAVDDEHCLPFSAAHVKAKPKLITDLDEVEALFERLSNASRFAYDTELTSLNRKANKLLTMQFSLSPKVGYIVPFLHRHSPWVDDNKAIQHIRQLARKLFCSPHVDPFGDRYICGLNLQFDLTQTREQLGIPIVTWPTFDVQNGEFCFDENLSELDSFAGNSPKAFSLAAVATRYGSVAYLEKEGFNKADRGNMAATSLDDQSVLDYMALDTQLPLAIADQQIRKAEAYGYDKFVKLVIGQQSNNQHAMSVMEHVGVHIDLDYLKEQQKPGSAMQKVLTDAKEQLYATPEVKEANDKLCAKTGVGGVSLFDDDEVLLFSVDKPEHRQVLFGDVMNLEPVSGYGKSTRQQGKLDKAFGVEGEKTMTLDRFWQATHRENYVVGLFTRVQKINKLLSSYIASFQAKIEQSDDGKHDGKLRPGFGYLYVKTGRGNSFSPSLQQTPSRGNLAKYVKRMFAAPAGHLILKTDYSANEVRFAANIARDTVMATPFRTARRLRSELFFADQAGDKEKVAELAKELKTKGDIHIANIYRFFQKWVDKKDPLRDAIKSIVFGCIYGKSVRTLGKDIWNNRYNESKDKLYAARQQLKDPATVEAYAESNNLSLSEAHRNLKALVKSLAEAVDVLENDGERCKPVAQEVVDKMKEEWHVLYGWMDDMHQNARTKLCVEAPHGRRRNLYGMLIPRNDIEAALCRRAVNAPVQGFGADVGHTSARLIDLNLHVFCRKFKLMRPDDVHVPGTVECAVHDALLQTVPYHLVLPYLQIQHWCMTVGVAEWFYDYYDDLWLVPPEVETEIGSHQAAMGTWDFTQAGLRSVIESALKEQQGRGLLDGGGVASAMAIIFSVPKDQTDYLNSRFPWFAKPAYEKEHCEFFDKLDVAP